MTSFTVYTEAKGARFKVDGQWFTSAQTFLWPVGSKHVVEIEPTQYSADSTRRTRWNFNGWADNTGNLSGNSAPVNVVTAHPAVTFLKATMGTEYQVSIQIFNIPAIDGVVINAAPVQCSTSDPGASPLMVGNSGMLTRPGAVSVDGTCYNADVRLWVAAGSTMTLNAYPYEGFVFTGWHINDVGTDAYVRQVQVREPLTVSPRFTPAKKVRLVTTPPGLRVMVDRAEVPTSDPADPLLPKPYPGTFDWALGSKHVLGAPSPQVDLPGNHWVFDSWDFGGGQSAVYTVDDKANVPVQLTAKFVRGVHVSFLTNPTGVKLDIDGRTNWPSPNFIWALGSRHTIIAPAETTDSKGRKYIFKGWSNGGPATQEIVVEESMLNGGPRQTANYEIMNRLTVLTTQAGVRVQVDGADCSLPCVLDRQAGTEVRLSAPPKIDFSDGARAEFAGWNDGVAGAERAIKLDVDERKVSFSYKTQFRLTTQVEPAGAGTVIAEPGSADGFYAMDQPLTLVAEAQAGYRFRRWEGDLTGGYKQSTLSMGAPRLVRAVFERAPFIATAGVRNAAGETPEQWVAPGSIISIVGASLANGYEVGPSSPLAQSIGGVTVRVEGRLLPLMFVSPEQINAQLPSDLPPGNYKLFVRVGMLPEVSASFQITRNAPGLFGTNVDGKMFLLAAHEDGSPVSLEKPAKKGETIALFGTGFGPMERPVPDGFAVPDSPSFNLADKVEVLAGETAVEASWAGAAAGFVGTNVARFKVAEELPSAATVEMKVRVNGVQSNTVLLPVE